MIMKSKLWINILIESGFIESNMVAMVTDLIKVYTNNNVKVGSNIVEYQRRRYEFHVKTKTKKRDLGKKMYENRGITR